MLLLLLLLNLTVPQWAVFGRLVLDVVLRVILGDNGRCVCGRRLVGDEALDAVAGNLQGSLPHYPSVFRAATLGGVDDQFPLWQCHTGESAR